MPTGRPRAARQARSKKIIGRKGARPKQGAGPPEGAPALRESGVAAAAVASPTVLLVNIIPRSRSDEEHQDSEPSLTVNPNNPLQIAASAFTPDPDDGDNAPIYASIDGGKTWILNSIVPSVAGSNTGTGDITLRFGSADTLYAGILRLPDELRMNVLRTHSFLGAEPMTVLLDVDAEQVDQPWVQTTTAPATGTAKAKDIVYVGSNRLEAASGRTAAIDLSFDAAAVKAEFKSVFIDQRDADPGGVDSPAVRPAIHSDGTVYVAFLHRRFPGAASDGFSLRRYDVVVVRDDALGGGTDPFSSLKDPEDDIAGIRVAQDRLIPWLAPGLGQERITSHLAIAVDPTDSKRVFLAWADRVDINKKDYTLHLRRSLDNGTTWSAQDLRTITNALNPALAVNSQGIVGFLYQQLTGRGAGERWETHFQLSSDGTNWNDLVLARVPAQDPPRQFFPYIGDYASLTAVGQDFYGIFSANNTPDLKNFPHGVSYQRNADFDRHHLLDEDGTNQVNVSIDPFFFKVTP